MFQTFFFSVKQSPSQKRSLELVKWIFRRTYYLQLDFSLLKIPDKSGHFPWEYALHYQVRPVSACYSEFINARDELAIEGYLFPEMKRRYCLKYELKLREKNAQK